MHDKKKRKMTSTWISYWKLIVVVWCAPNVLSYYVKDNPNATLASLYANTPRPPPPFKLRLGLPSASPIRRSLQDAKRKKNIQTNKQINCKTQYERQKKTNNTLQGDLAVQHFLSIFLGHCRGLEMLTPAI